MDIVKTNIMKLGGLIEIESEIDKGTTIRLKMPITLSVIRTLIVTIDSIEYAVPETNVERIVRIWKATPSRRIERLNNSLVLILDERVIPVVTMDEIDAKSRGRKPLPVETMLERIHGNTVTKFIILKADGKSFAVLIDNAHKSEQTLIKPLPEYLKSCLCYSSVTVLGNGNAIAILDAEGIIRLMGIEAASQSAATINTIDGTAGEIINNEKQIIIFKCSGTEYFALDIDEISRIEAINPENIQEIDNEPYINIAGATVRVVRPEDYTPVKKNDYTAKKLFLMTYKNSASPIGFLAGKIIDKVTDNFELNKSQFSGDYIHGTGRLNEKILIFLNPGSIMNDIEDNKQKIKTSGKKGKVL
jgi:two-component system chemotaxis sensor kinase CheA